jgi:signal transduction histidine kinase
MSLRWRFFLAFALVIAITVAAVAVSVRLSAAHEFSVFQTRGGMIGAESLVTALQDYYQSHGSWEGVGSVFAGIHPGKGPGGPGYGSGGSFMGFRLALPDGELVYAPGGEAQSSPVSPEILASGFPIQVNGKTAGILLPPAGQSFPESSFDTQLLQIVNKASLTAALISGVVALVLASMLAYFMVQPVKQLTKAASGMAEGDLSQRVNMRAAPELNTLAGAFNHMASSLEQAEEKRRAMTADIAHELRTPLAVQRANLEAMQDGIYPLNEENLQKILEQNTLLTRLVEDLRTLTLADAGKLQLERTPVHLKVLIGRLATRFQARADQKGIRIAVNLPEESLPAHLDSQRVEQILNNLLDNSIRHTPDGGTVFLSLEFNEHQAVVQVRDTGPGIPQEDLPYIFDRFYRTGRARNRQDGGSGLGLAIARKLVEAHGGTLTARNAPEGGAVFTLTFPRE